MLILTDISVHQQQEVCNREVWGWGVAYQLETWRFRLDVSPPPKFCYNKDDWMPAPDTIDPPSSDTMLALVAEQIGKMDGRASPGFDCVAASFIKNAVEVRPKPDGRAW